MDEWTVLYTQTYEDWFFNLTEVEQESILIYTDLLELRGPNLSRPYADTIKGSKLLTHLKELRVQHIGSPYRIFYAFDPNRNAILLCGGRKDGKQDKRFYKRMLKLAEEEYLFHLQSINCKNDK